ncbi:oxygenase MpaB family protein [Streptomyces sp. NBC_01497]|uniref:oxygenase MpaB family protein n=1 Tax=Streptomyces sp. NBC_01497 TaxID=2903885 RepID=UPI003FCC5030
MVDLPRDQAQLARRMGAYRAVSHARPEARPTVRLLVLKPPLPWPPCRPAAGVLAANGVSMLPLWARAELMLPYVPAVAEPSTKQTTSGVPAAGTGSLPVGA